MNAGREIDPDEDQLQVLRTEQLCETVMRLVDGAIVDDGAQQVDQVAVALPRARAPVRYGWIAKLLEERRLVELREWEVQSRLQDFR